MESARPRRSDRVLGFALVGVVVLFAVRVGTYAFAFEPASRILAEIAIGAMLLGWGVSALWRPDLRPSTILAGPVALACVAFGVSVLASERPRLSLEPALVGIASALTLLMLTSLLRVASIRRLLATLIVVGAVVIMVGYLAQVAVEWARFWTLLGHFAAPPLRPSFVALEFGTPNLIATFVLLLAPLATVLAWQSAGGRIAMGLAAISVVAIVLAGSRGGYLGLGAGCAVAAAIGSSVFGARVRLRGVRLGRRRALATGGGIIAIVAVVLVLVPSVMARLTLGGADLRLWYWRAATELFKRAPLTGTGPGTWAQLKIGEALPTEVNFVVPHAHSLFFQTLSEVGLLGLAGLLIFAAVVLWRFHEVYARSDRFGRLQVVAILLSLAGLIGQQIPDYVMNVPAVALVAGLLIAWVDGMEPAVTSTRRIPRLGVRLGGQLAVVLGALLLAATPTLVRIDRAMWIADDAGWAASGGDWSAALAGYERALTLDPTFALYRLERANSLAHLGRLPEARDAYAGVVDEDLLPENVLSLASIDLALGDTKSAARLAGVGLSRGWRDPAVALNAGHIFEATGDRQRAIQAYAAAILENIPLARSSYWVAPERSVTRSEVIERAHRLMLTQGDPAGAATMAAYAGDATLAQQDLALIAAGATRDLFGAVVEAISGDQRAGLATLTDIVQRHPGNFEALSWLARLLTGADDPAGARYAALASIERADEAPDAASVRSAVPAIDSERYLGAWTSYPLAVYSRRGPADLWPPQFLVIGVTEAP